ncbi:YaeQ family protein [Noviherbaspirillum pedocola]|uniref:YaeQ family protein n=1 Tax=Noviherbaspirillum pedocola TaxID=2801341 RepID=A0A934W9H1_9BURK|nr:YaeQ family protein [Noviherbaspirillum pedocola]MBK4738103.1 YaeQ family protein [Noviherbaspirillum pedocola]
MALKSTIYKAEVQIADMDRPYYGDHALTLARHPSETEERLMMRLLAFIRHADAALQFGKGLSDADEPDLWQKDLTGAIQLWIEVGNPDERRILRACGRSAEVVVYSYGSVSPTWWSGIGARVQKAENLRVYTIAPETSAALAELAQRGMQIQCTVQDGDLWISSGEQTVPVQFQPLKSE